MVNGMYSSGNVWLMGCMVKKACTTTSLVAALTDTVTSLLAAVAAVKGRWMANGHGGDGGSQARA